MMTRKHFAAIAAALQSNRPTIGQCGYAEALEMCLQQWADDCRAIADVCERENPNFFDRARFLTACGVN